VLGEFTTHTNPKLLGPDGLPGHAKTVGLMRRRQIRSNHAHTTHGGTEVPMRESIRDDLLTELDDDKPIIYRDRTQSSLQTLVLPALRSFTPGPVAERSRLPLRSIKRWRGGGVIPRDAAISKLTAALVSLAREELHRQSIGGEREKRMRKFGSRSGLKQRPEDMRGVLDDYLELAARRTNRSGGTAPLDDDLRAILREHRPEAQQRTGLSRDTLRRAIAGKALRPNTRDACVRTIEQLAGQHRADS
jgi:ribosomal protein S24E